MKSKVSKIFDVSFFIFVIAVHAWAILELPKPIAFKGWSQALELISEAQFLSMLVIALSVICLVVLLFKQFHDSHSKWLSGIFLGLALASIPSSPLAQTIMLCVLSGILKNLDEKTYNKFKNEDVSEADTDVASTRRPF